MGSAKQNGEVRGTERALVKECIKCGQIFEYMSEDTFWNENGMSSTKLVKCPCGCVQAIEYEELHDVNNDSRYYQ